MFWAFSFRFLCCFYLFIVIDTRRAAEPGLSEHVLQPGLVRAEVVGEMSLLVSSIPLSICSINLRRETGREDEKSPTDQPCFFSRV